MRKKLLIGLTLLNLIAITACEGTKEKIDLPDLDKVAEVEVIPNTSQEITKIKDKDDIEKIWKHIEKEDKKTGKKSVNDQPTNINEYYSLLFHEEGIKENPVRIYVYEDKNTTYLEQPYVGIWKIDKEVLDQIKEMAE